MGLFSAGKGGIGARGKSDEGMEEIRDGENPKGRIPFGGWKGENHGPPPPVSREYKAVSREYKGILMRGT